MKRFKRPSNGTVIASVALFIAMGGTALAATGQLVNITDGSNSSLIAHVTASGQLRVTTQQEAASRPWFLLGNIYTSDVVASGYNFLWSTPTSAKIAIDRVTLNNYPVDTQRRLVELYFFTVNSGQGCNSSATWQDVRQVAAYQATPENTVVENLTTPLVLQPLSGRNWCLSAVAETATSGDTYYSYLHLGGFVVNGTAPVSAARSSKSAQKQHAKSSR
jgi:hypothetical protein